MDRPNKICFDNVNLKPLLMDMFVHPLAKKTLVKNTFNLLDIFLTNLTLTVAASKQLLYSQ